MVKLKTWIKASRPRTVLLSFSGVLLGSFLSIAKVPEPVEGPTQWLTLLFCTLTAVLLQVLSNLANDYGDFKKGTDSAKRVGPQREMQSGAITEKEMKRGLAVTAALCLISGALLIFVFAGLTWQELAVFAALGIGAVLAALLYTLGKHPYGYRGLGDLYCFLFFGWAAVFGTFYLATKMLDFSVQLPATAMGFLSNAVLNINNMRDYENDKASGKNSLVVKLGLKKAFVYHCILIIGAFVCLTVYLILKHAPYYIYAFWLLFPLFLKDLIAIKKTKPELLDPFLGRQVKHSFLLVMVYGSLLLTCHPMPHDTRQAARDALDKEQQTMMFLDIYLNNSKKANLLNDLEHSVFGDKDHWKAMLAVVEEKYPDLWETLGQKYPDLDEDEKKSFILSHFKVSRQEEADYLGTTVNMVDKLRGRRRRKMENQKKQLKVVQLENNPYICSGIQ